MTAPSYPPGYQPAPASAPVAPPPPPGPGVQPPFPAPPVEGKGKRLGMSLGIAAGVVVLVCGGGIAAVIGLGHSMTGALNEQAKKVTGDYVDALEAKEYDKAYAMLCKQAQDDESPSQYRARVGAMQQIASYTLEDLDVVNMAVPVDVTYESGDNATLQAYLGQDSSTGAFEVCDLGE